MNVNTEKNSAADDINAKVLATIRYNSLTYAAEAIFASSLRGHINLDNPKPVVCVGTDRSTGDSYGPLLGTFLRSVEPEFPVYGTLDDPVHASNMREKVEAYGWSYGRVLAVDACLGRAENIGMIKLLNSPLAPGTGVNKTTLPLLGPPSILGIVNVGGFMEYFVLQNTRLSLVLPMVYTTAKVILQAYGVNTKLSDIRDPFVAMVESFGRMIASSKEEGL